MRPREQVLLAERTTLGMGGPARYWLEPSDAEAVVRALAWADARALEVIVLGAGSNVVIADRGLDALVLRLRLAGTTYEERGGETMTTAGAGVGFDRLVADAVARGLAGLECLSGIPGDVGAAPIQNVGAYGQEVSQTIERVDAIERDSGARVALAPADCGFGYRDSRFKGSAEGRYIITAVRFRLRAGGEPTVSYPALRSAIEGEPTLASLREAVIAQRRSKSMVLDDDDENCRSAGSFFVNPVVSQAEAEQAVARARALVGEGEPMPQHPAAGGGIKLAAAWLIERAGMSKGTVRGRVGISTRHSLALVNRGGATAVELIAFAAEVRDRVREAFGVTLTPEPRLLGFEPAELAHIRD